MKPLKCGVNKPQKGPKQKTSENSGAGWQNKNVPEVLKKNRNPTMKGRYENQLEFEVNFSVLRNAQQFLCKTIKYEKCCVLTREDANAESSSMVDQSVT